jgi:hypothetical protein
VWRKEHVGEQQPNLSLVILTETTTYHNDRSMRQPKKAGAVVNFVPRPAQITEMVQRAAASSANVFFSDHSLDRMEERGIDTIDALRVLREGDLSGPIEAGKKEGEWKCKFVKRMKGAREVGVVTLVMSNGRLFVKTVEWEDL